MKNLTPHTVTVRGVQDYVYPPSGSVARVSMTARETAPAPDGCPTIEVTYGEAILPEGEPGPVIVSTMFADVYRRQHGENGVQLFVPDSGPTAIREGGQIVAVRALIRR